MTPFEIIILIVIYMVCYGYTLAMFIKEKNVWFRILYTIMSLVLVVNAPIIFGGMLYEKMEK